jgi:uncharacterized membrane protein
MTPWKLPLIVAAIMVPIVVAFYLGGGGVGLGLGAMTVFAVAYYAVRQKPRGPIVSAAAPDDEREHVLVVAASRVEEPADVTRIADAARLDEGAADVLILAPASIGFLDRWASDVEGARQSAQRRLVATVAAFAKAGIEAEARVGDEDVVQAVEDQLQTFPATRVILAAGEDAACADAARELAERVEADFHQVVIMSAG